MGSGTPAAWAGAPWTPSRSFSLCCFWRSRSSAEPRLPLLELTLSPVSTGLRHPS